jgi:4-amino-4-deoxy-L-arabinose transferase-like glycosyltransferase
VWAQASNSLPVPFSRTTKSETRLVATWRRLLAHLPEILFVLSLLVYLATRLIGLTRFPIYFFTDEAAQTVLAADFVRDGLHNGDKELLPAFFKNGSYYNLGTSVYLQILPYLIFGKSVFITRAVSVFVSLLAAVSISLILRNFMQARYWWSGVLLLSIMPAWFLHSRTAFETVVFVSFYAATLYAYLLYRLRSPRYLYLTLVLAALAFYAYSPGQLVVAATGLILLIVDARYHWENRRVVGKGMLLAVLLGLPYLRFRIAHSIALLEHLHLLGSYWLQPLPLAEKLRRFAAIYLDGLNPAYWFIPNDRDLPRHLMKGYGHIPLATLPLALLGMVISLARLRQPQYRLLWIALLAGPVSSALVGVGITRLLVMVIPAVLFITLGLEVILEWLEQGAAWFQRRGFRFLSGWVGGRKLFQAVVSMGLFILLSAVNFALLRDSLVNGPTWYQDYGIGGMQYGAQQAFEMAKDYLQRHPQTEIIFSPTWANGTDVLARFFLGDPLPLQLGSIQGHIDHQLPLSDDMLFIVTPTEYQAILSNEKFTAIQVEQVLPYPDGAPGFYFMHLKYSEKAADIFASEAAQRRKLQQAEVQLNGQPVQVRYSFLDMGEIEQVFDGDEFTFVRTAEANPLVIELLFPRLRQVRGLDLIIGSADVEITVESSVAGSSERRFTIQQKGLLDQPQVHLDFGELVAVQQMRIKILDRSNQEPAHVHLWEIYIKDN